MKPRPFWQSFIEREWERRSVVWLSGVRRAGKTTLCMGLPDVVYFDCELPRTRRRMEDPEGFLAGLRGRRVVLDEIHRLDNPAQLLKIAADHYPDVRVLATGSSTLGASAKFRDTLAGRKAEVWLTPMITDDLASFGDTRLERRFLHGGLPPFFLPAEVPARDFQEWMDAYWAKDVLELFRLERRASFQKFAELLFSHSGGMFEATRYARPCEVSRTTIANYLAVLEATFVMHVVRPFSTRKSAEIVSAPKVFGFDTGFVCYHRDWRDLRTDDMGLLWEHFVLNEIHARLQSRSVHYWRDKQGHEVDFVLAAQRDVPVAIECKWSASEFDPSGLSSFRGRYPAGENYVVAHDVDSPYQRKYGDIAVRFVGLRDLVESL